MKFRHSMKFKLTMIMAAVVTAVVVIVCVLNTVFFERYYVNNRQKTLKESYNQLIEYMQTDNVDSKELADKIKDINARHNINVFILDSNWGTSFTSQLYVQDLRWLQEFMFAKDNGNEILEDMDAYTLQKGYDRITGMSYLVIYGSVNDGISIVMQVVLESVVETVQICNRFVIFVGLIVLIISVIAVSILASRFTRPMKELSELAVEMSHMNLEARYSGKDQGEIGMLGESMNIMSECLQENISELHRANIALKKDIDIKNKNEQMRREFISNVSHELKTPIALIQGYAEGLKEGISDDPDSFNYYCDVILDESQKMNHLVKNLLTLNQLEYGRQTSQMERFDISQLMRDVVKANIIRAEQKNIQLTIDNSAPIFVVADELQIEEVATNFLSNAINHCSGERLVHVTLRKENAHVRVDFMNTGDSIPEDSLDRIWEKFYKVDKARTREYGGNGIGLSIVKAIIDNHNGAYGVENLPNGVNFYFMLECEP